MPNSTHFVRYGHDINIFSQGLGFMSQAEKANIKSAGKYFFMRLTSRALVACKLSRSLMPF